MEPQRGPEAGHEWFRCRSPPGSLPAEEEEGEGDKGEGDHDNERGPLPSQVAAIRGETNPETAPPTPPAP